MGERVFNADHELLTCKCPVCGSLAFPYAGSFRSCPKCHWMDDPVQSNEPDEDFGANFMSLNQARDAWNAGQPIQ